MNVLSLFDGISCGLQALKRINIPVTSYYASEIDRHAINISRKNHPEILHIGDINNWESWKLPKIDLILGGSPCQGFSFAGKQLAFNDPRSALFFKFVEVLKYYKPKYFLLENVRMKREYQDVISKYIGVEPICINSSLVSAQNRLRYYWTSIPVTYLPDKNIKLTDILEDRGTGWIKNNGVYHARNNKSMCIDANYHKGVDNHGQRTMIKTVQTSDEYRKLTPIECERLQTLPDDYTAGVSNTQRYKMLGNGWTVDVISHILSSIINL